MRWCFCYFVRPTYVTWMWPMPQSPFPTVLCIVCVMGITRCRAKTFMDVIKVGILRKSDSCEGLTWCVVSKFLQGSLNRGQAYFIYWNLKDNFQDTYVRTPSGSWGRSAAVAATALCRPGGSGACRPATVPLAPWAYLRRKWSTPRGSTCAHGCKKNVYSYRF